MGGGFPPPSARHVRGAGPPLSVSLPVPPTHPSPSPSRGTPRSVYWEGSTLCTVVLSGAWVFLALQYFWCFKVVKGMQSVMKSSGGRITVKAFGVDKVHNA